MNHLCTEFILTKITLEVLDKTDHLTHPEEYSEINLDSPAVSIFTDYRQHNPLELESDTPAIQAQYLMRKAHVQLKVVVNKDRDLVGIISLNELEDQKLLMLQSKGIDRNFLLVSDLMIPKSALKSVDINQLLSCSVAELIESLELNNTQYCLVVEKELHEIRGCISVSDIALRLHMPINISPPMTTFSDIFIAVNS